MKRYKAILFDLNGTMINDMPFHIKAWYRLLNELGAGISMKRTKEECYGKNQELLERIFPGRFTAAEKDKLSYEKEKQYQQEFRPHLKLIDGLDVFLESSYKSGIKLAIGSAAIMFNIDFVVDGLNIRHYFEAIVSADDVVTSKPDPETWLKCAEKLGVNKKDCIVMEDAPKGVEAAQAAGMEAWVITTLHLREDFVGDENVIGFSENFKDPVMQGTIIHNE